MSDTQYSVLCSFLWKSKFALCPWPFREALAKDAFQQKEELALWSGCFPEFWRNQHFFSRIGPYAVDWIVSYCVLVCGQTLLSLPGLLQVITSNQSRKVFDNKRMNMALSVLAEGNLVAGQTAGSRAFLGVFCRWAGCCLLGNGSQAICLAGAQNFWDTEINTCLHLLLLKSLL